jgi:hypothetical protein
MPLLSGLNFEIKGDLRVLTRPLYHARAIPLIFNRQRRSTTRIIRRRTALTSIPKSAVHQNAETRKPHLTYRRSQGIEVQIRFVRFPDVRSNVEIGEQRVAVYRAEDEIKPDVDEIRREDEELR